MNFDVVFVGGGLSAALGALALLERRPDARVCLLERNPTLGAEHTWCFHAADVPVASREWLAPLVVRRWPGYSVRFPRRVRRLASEYACVSGERLHAVVTARLARAPNARLLLGRDARALTRDSVTLDDGATLSADLVLDARGPSRCEPTPERGYQKFLGLELSVDPGHAIREPLMMDATVPQTDGFRFVYALPLSDTRILIEDTYFSDTPSLDEAASERDILAWARAQGLTVRAVERRERAALPMPWRCALPEVSSDGPVRAGYAGGYFHPTTGYSFPIALRFAEALAEGFAHGHDLAPLRAMTSAHAAQLAFLLTLTRTMFTWFEPPARYCVLEHFYRLPERLIERFYAASLTPFDRARIMLGAPPRGLSMRRMWRAEVAS